MNNYLKKCLIPKIIQKIVVREIKIFKLSKQQLPMILFFQIAHFAPIVVFNSFKSIFNCFKGAMQPYDIYIPRLKGVGLQG